MTLLNRYVDAVRGALPRENADDVAAEIGDELQSQIEDREATLGRMLTEEEQVQILRRYGHPRAVAARYSAVHWLVGPTLLPFYWAALSTIAPVVIAVELLAGIGSAILAHNGQLFFDALGNAFESAVWIFTIVTLAFAVAERVPRVAEMPPVRLARDWDPRDLPSASAIPPPSKFSAIIEFIANGLALLVVLDAGSQPHRIPLDEAFAVLLREMHVTLTPAWHATAIGIIAGSGLLAVSALGVFVRPRYAGVHEAARLTASIIVFVGLTLTLTSGPLVAASSPREIASAAVYGVLGGLAAMALQAIVSARALLRARRPVPEMSARNAP